MTANRLKSLLAATSISTDLWILLCFFELCTSPPYSVKFWPHNLNFSHSPDHIWDIEVSPGLLTKEFGLRPIVSLPALTKRMIHPIIGKVVVLEVKVVEVIAGRLYFFPVKDPYQLRLCLFVSNQDLSLSCLLYCSFCLSRQLVLFRFYLLYFMPEEGKTNLIVHY